VSFNGSASSDPDGTISSYAWTFGDGGTGSGVTASHTYTTAGTFTAKLTVTDNLGATASTTATITVTSNVVAAPSSLTASASNGKVTLKWKDNSNNETAFLIERAPSGTTNFVQVGQAPANAVTWSETLSRATYLYRIRAFNSSTNTYSAYANQVQIRVK
jgi:PKD repeat protein